MLFIDLTDHRQYGCISPGEFFPFIEISVDATKIQEDIVRLFSDRFTDCFLDCFFLFDSDWVSFRAFLLYYEVPVDTVNTMVFILSRR